MAVEAETGWDYEDEYYGGISCVFGVKIKKCC